MQQRSLWRMFWLTLLTLGLYQLVWYSRTRNELVEKFKQDIPPFQLYLLYTLGGIFVGIVSLSIMSDQRVIAPITFIIGFGVSIGYSMYWNWKYAVGFSAATNNVFSPLVAFLFIIFLDELSPLALQHYYNQTVN